MCTAPSPISSSWQFCISWPCSTLIKCFSEHHFQVSWCRARKQSQGCIHRALHLSTGSAPSFMFSLPSLRAIYLWEALPLHNARGHHLCSLLPSRSLAGIWNLRLREQLQNSAVERVSHLRLLGLEVHWSSAGQNNETSSHVSARLGVEVLVGTCPLFLQPTLTV